MSKLQSEKAKKSWEDPVVRKRRLKALRLANGKPRTAEHRRKLGLAHIGLKYAKETKKQMSASRLAFMASRPEGACAMCGSLAHTLQQHKQRAEKARLKSKKWQQAVVENNRILKTGTKASAKTRKRMSASQLVVQNTPEMRKIHSEKSKQMWANRTKAQRKSIAEKSSKTQQGRIPNFDRFGQYYEGHNGKIWMRSGYEVKFAEWLDNFGISWEFEPRSFNVGLGNWNGSNYTPDFYIPAHDLWIEIKGYLRDENIRKLNKFFELWPAIAEKWHMLKQDGLLALGVL